MMKDKNILTKIVEYGNLNSDDVVLEIGPGTGNLTQEILEKFYEKETYEYDEKISKWKTKFDPENYKAKNFSEEVVDSKTKKVVIKLGEKVNFLAAKKLANEGLKEIFVIFLINGLSNI